MVELAEGPGEGGLPALVGTGHDDDALGAVQVEVVGDYRRAPRDELVRQGQVEGADDADVLGAGGDLGIAETQPGGANRPDVIQEGEVELELLASALDSLVGEPGVLAAVLVQGGELFREQPGHQLDDLGGDVVHPWLRPVADQVVLGRALLEPVEGAQHRGAVVGFAGVAAHLDPAAVDAGAVADLREGVLAVPGIGGQGGKPGRGDIGGEVVPEGQEGAGADRRRGQMRGQRGHRGAVDGRRVQQPALPLVAVPHHAQLAQVGAYLDHQPGKLLDRIQQGRVLQVPEDLLPVAHRTGIAQTSVQDRGDEVTLLAIPRDRRHDLVQVQIPRVGAIPGLVPSGPGRRRLFGQQAQEMILAPGGWTSRLRVPGHRRSRGGPDISGSRPRQLGLLVAMACPPVFWPLGGQQEPSATRATPASSITVAPILPATLSASPGDGRDRYHR